MMAVRLKKKDSNSSSTWIYLDKRESTSGTTSVGCLTLALVPAMLEEVLIGSTS